MRKLTILTLSLMPMWAWAAGDTVGESERADVELDEGAPPSRLVASLGGSSGPLRVAAAAIPEPITIGTGLWFEFLSQDDLILAGDSNTRVIGTLTMNIAGTEFVETFLTLRSIANSNTQATPQLMQSMGDFSLGFKGAYPVIPGLGLGGLAQLQLLNAPGDLGWTGAATTVHLKGLLSVDGREFDPDAIVRGHLNIGYSFQNGDALAGGRSLEPVEQFANQVYQFDTMDLGLAIEALPASIEGVSLTPFLEWGLQVPLGTRLDTSDVCVEELPCPADPDAGFGSFPQRVSLGLLAEVIPGLVLRSAVDIGLTQTIVAGLPAMPNYNVIFGMAYNVDSASREPQVIVKEVPSKRRAPALGQPPVGGAKAEGMIRGRVLSARTRKPIAVARVSYPRQKLNAQLTSKDGSFTSYRLPPGPVRIIVDAPGHRRGAFQIPIKQGTVEFSFPLQPSAGKASPRSPTPVPPPPPPGASSAGPGGAGALPPPPPVPASRPRAVDPLAPGGP